MRCVPDTECCPSVVCTPKYALKKARAGIPLSRWELAGIAGDAVMAFQYARNVVRGRFPAGEPAIMRSAMAVGYAVEFIGGRWEEAEGFICRNADQVYSYSKSLVGGRWLEGEAAVLGDFNVSMRYLRDIVGGRWEELEVLVGEYLVGRKPWEYCWTKPMVVLRDYMRFVRCRVPLFEEVLSSVDRPGSLFLYSLGIGGRLPGVLHNKMMMYGFSDRGRVWNRRYVRYLEGCRVRALHYVGGLDGSELEEFLSCTKSGVCP